MKIIVKDSPIQGRGVFATKSIRKNELIEVCHIIEIPKEQSDIVDSTVFGNYRFEFGENSAIALGNGSLYNHSYNPNAVVWIGDKTIKFRARRNIKKDEEITFNYMGGVNCKDKTWF